MGGNNSPDYKNDAKGIESIKYAVKSGINIIDTAEYYGHRYSEELVGKAIKDFNICGREVPFCNVGVKESERFIFKICTII